MLWVSNLIDSHDDTCTGFVWSFTYLAQTETAGGAMVSW
jgi:hypothetical protein